MVNFPSLTPSDFRWEAPTYEQVSHTAEDGAIVRQILMDTPGQGRVEVEFQNCRDSDFEAVLAAHDATYGQWDALTLPDAFWAGRGAALKAVINSYDARLEWAFAEVPAADWAKKGRGTIKVTLKHRVRPLALTLAPGGTATPLVPKTDPGTPALVDALPVLNCNIVVPPLPDLVGCQAFWTSRQVTPMLDAVADVNAMTVVDSQGNSYAASQFCPVGALGPAENALLLVKRDKDGAVLWQRKTAGLGGESFFDVDIRLDSTGVFVSVVSSGFALNNRLWRVTSAGTQAFAGTYGQNQGTPTPVELPVLLPSGNVFVTQRSSSSLWMMLLSGTGAIQNIYFSSGAFGPKAQPVLLPSGRLLLIGSRDSQCAVCEIDPAAGVGSIQSIYVYPGTPSQGFDGIIPYGADSWLLHSPNGYIYLMANDYSILWAKQVSASLPVLSLRWMAVDNDILYIAFRGELTLRVDLATGLAGAFRQDAYWYNNQTGMENQSNYDRAARPAFDFTANLDVSWQSMGTQAITQGDALRFMVMGFGLKAPNGNHTIETQPPYINRQASVTVSSVTYPLTVLPTPVRTVATLPAVVTRTYDPPTPDSTRPLLADTTVTWDLQAAPICPPAFNVTIAGSITAAQGIAQQYTAVIVPDPTLTTWPYTYTWSSPNATFSDNKIANPFVTWNAVGTRTLSVQAFNAGYIKTATLDVAVATAPP
jgi:hypothetical protein